MKKNYNRPITDCVEINAFGVLMGSAVEKPAAVISSGSGAIQTPSTINEDNLF